MLGATQVQNSREYLRQFISLMLDEYVSQVSEKEIMPKRIGTVFHETFTLSRTSINAILSVINSTDLSDGLYKTLRSQTHLGTNYIKAMPQYARGLGLLTMDNQLSSFGLSALQFDPLLEKPATLWLMHYFMSAPHGPGPAFWYEFVRTRFRYGDEFTKSSLADQLIDFINVTESRNLKENSAASTANAFVGTYEKDDGLGRLGLFENDGDRYRIIEPYQAPPLWAFAIAFLDFCQHQFPDQMTINLESLYADGGLTSVFMIGEGRINRYLRQLQEVNIVDIFRVAPPYQVVLINPDPSIPFANLYKTDEYNDD